MSRCRGKSIREVPKELNMFLSRPEHGDGILGQGMGVRRVGESNWSGRR
jgi:hypothetical protein